MIVDRDKTGEVPGLKSVATAIGILYSRSKSKGGSCDSLR